MPCIKINRCDSGALICCGSISTVITLSIFLGCFFAVTYPEMVVNKDSREVSCLITNTTIETSYCPNLVCTACSDSSGLSSCGDVTAEMINYNPATCSPNQTQNCPISPQQCNNGYKCCAQCCSTCTSCHQSCSNNKQPNIQSNFSVNNSIVKIDTSHQCNFTRTSNMTLSEIDIASLESDKYVQHSRDQTQGCSTSCYTYSCNCHCCNHVNHLTCTATADICFNAVLFIDYTTLSGELQNTTYVKKFGTSRGNAEKFIAQYPIDGSKQCYYDVTDLTVIRWSVSYTKGYYALDGIFGTLALVSSMILLHGILQECLPGVDGNTVFGWSAFSWLSIIIPLLILLPIYETVPLSASNLHLILMLIAQFVTIGMCVPLAIRAPIHYSLAYVLTIYVPWGILLPLAWLIPNVMYIVLLWILPIPVFCIAIVLIHKRKIIRNAIVNYWNNLVKPAVPPPYVENPIPQGSTVEETRTFESKQNPGNPPPYDTGNQPQGPFTEGTTVV
jgi:hypothetical protein